VSIRVVLADDHPIVRQGLGAMLRSVEGIDVAGEATNGREALHAAVTLAPDVIILDIHMPELDGVAAAREIRRAAPQVGILMLTMLDDDDSVRAALHAGAAGYVLKGDPQQKIVRAIQAVAAGDAFLTAGIAGHILNPGSPVAERDHADLAGLTAREQRILDLLASGLSTTAIATRLGIASKTVSNNLSTIFSKLGVTNRTEAALHAKQAGLGSPPRIDPHPARARHQLPPPPSRRPQG
jgi:DNA-binding NarL/FixJ family response regulator